jgi:hypothetical protein
MRNGWESLSGCVDCCRRFDEIADLTRLRCARDGGLNDESRTYNWRIGDALGGWLEGTVWTTLKAALDEVKSLSTWANCLRSCRRDSMSGDSDDMVL